VIAVVRTQFISQSNLTAEGGEMKRPSDRSSKPDEERTWLRDIFGSPRGQEFLVYKTRLTRQQYVGMDPLADDRSIAHVWEWGPGKLN